MELTDMSGTSLIDVGNARYDDEVLDALGLLPWNRIMPPLKRSADICGTITPEPSLRCAPFRILLLSTTAEM